MLIRITLPLILALILVPLGHAQDKTNPIEAEVKANLKDLSKPFVMLVTIKIKDGNAEKFEAAFTKARTATRKEKGNKAYTLNRSAKVPSEYVMYERWADFAALQDHMKLPHFSALIAEVHDMFDGPPDVKVFVPVRE